MDLDENITLKLIEKYIVDQFETIGTNGDIYPIIYICVYKFLGPRGNVNLCGTCRLPRSEL